MPPGILVFTLNQGVHAQTGTLHLQSPKLAPSHLSQGAEHVFVKDNKEVADTVPQNTARQFNSSAVLAHSSPSLHVLKLLRNTTQTMIFIILCWVKDYKNIYGIKHPPAHITPIKIQSYEKQLYNRHAGWTSNLVFWNWMILTVLSNPNHSVILCWEH